MSETGPVTPEQVEVNGEYWLCSQIQFLVRVRVLSIKYSTCREVPDMYHLMILDQKVRDVFDCPNMMLGANCFKTREEAVPVMVAIIEVKDKILQDKIKALETQRALLQDERDKYIPRKKPINKLS